MSRHQPFGRRLRPIVAATCGIAIGIAGIGLATVPAAGAPTAAPPSAPGAVAGSSVTVTLITGDRVTVTGLSDGTQAVEIATAVEGAGVKTFNVGGDLHVIPDSAAPYLASGVLDGDLFNVTQLIEFGYDDASVDATPVIVQKSGAQSRTAPLPGIELSAPLPSIHGAAGTVEHDGTAALWSALTTEPQARSMSNTPTLAGGITAIHLDGKVTASLDSSVPFIDAPEAWAEGYDGEGVTVAVLDTGYDDTHPDLEGRVSADSVSFVPGEDVATDGNGHGTHVASTIAGSGAASDGTHRGVAPEAHLLVGKVLGDDGSGQDSWIIEAMEWAGQRAPIVSMSLGSREASDGHDLMAESLNEISEETGALFVVAAGNSSSPETIGSPGSAELALTVGSVDDPSGERSYFSSQGPLARSGAMKPDIVAPGAEITAARSADSGGSGPYITMSGTSMATPHVAGAAAILKQRHPEYTATQLKAALTSTTADVGLTSYEGGSGLVDVDASMDAPVVAAGSGDFGMLKWGEEPTPVVRTIEYTNRSAAEVTVALEARLVDTTPGTGDGSASDALTLGAPSLVIPAGEMRSVDLTVDPAKVALGTELTGSLVASIDGTPVARTALGTLAETERYDLTLTATDFDGNPTATLVYLWEAEHEFFSQLIVDGESTVRIAGGQYAVMSYMETSRTPDTKASVLLGNPAVNLDKDTTVALDARSATKVTVDVGAKGDVAPVFQRMDYTADGFSSSALMQVTIDEMWAQPMTAPDADAFDFTTRWRLLTPLLSVTAGKDALDVITQGGSTLLDGTIKAPAVAVGNGSADEFAAVDVAGKVAVVTRSAAVSAPERAANAAAAGAKMLIVVNDGDGEFNESFASADGAATIPVAGISGVQGTALLTKLQGTSVTIAATGTPASEVSYDVARYSKGSIPSDLAYVPQDLARIDTMYHGDPELVAEFRLDFAPNQGSSSTFPMRTSRGIEREEWVSTDGFRWYQTATVQSVGWQIRDVKREYQPGERITSGYFGGIVRPYVGPGYFAPYNQATFAQVNVPSWADGASAAHTGAFDVFQPTSGAQQLTQAYVDGSLVKESVYQSVNVRNLTDGIHDWRIVNTATHDGTHLAGSTSTVSEWTFRSKTEGANWAQVLMPLIQAYYDVDVNKENRAGEGRKKGAPVELGLEVGHLAGVTGADKITETTLEARVAGGEWVPVTLKAAETDAPTGATDPATGIFPTGRSFVSGFTTKIAVPDAGGWIDLRVTAKDAAGNTFTQEIVKAFEATPAKGSTNNGHRGAGGSTD